MTEVYEFKLIVAGGRNFNDKELLNRELDKIVDWVKMSRPGYSVSIVSGMAKGADMLGYLYSKENNLKCYEFPADWNNLDVEGAIPKKNRFGKTYNVVAGHQRNQKMSEFGDALLLFWDGTSTGSKDMLNRMEKAEKPVWVVRYDKD